MWVPEGTFPNPFGFSIFGGLSLTVLCFPTLGFPPPPLCVQSYILLAGSPDFVYFCMWKGTFVMRPPPQIGFTCQIGATGPSCFISFEIAKGYALALRDVERRARCLLNLG